MAAAFSSSSAAGEETVFYLSSEFLPQATAPVGVFDLGCARPRS
jgi:hypothetical protein